MKKKCDFFEFLEKKFKKREKGVKQERKSGIEVDIKVLSGFSLISGRAVD
ncbi:MAG: hypothetical protein GY754_15580 [bacterium]|nr:hypothetical protein [bacterium]